MTLRAAASAAMPVARVRQLRDAQKSGGTQSANISSVNRRENIVPSKRSMNEDRDTEGRPLTMVRTGRVREGCS
jgi:hypothetical protein